MHTFRMTINIKTFIGLRVDTRENIIDDTRTCSYVDNSPGMSVHTTTHERTPENKPIPARQYRRCARNHSQVHKSTQGRLKTHRHLHTRAKEHSTMSLFLHLCTDVTS